jgi:hypothetical protein
VARAYAVARLGRIDIIATLRRLSAGLLLTEFDASVAVKNGALHLNSLWRANDVHALYPVASTGDVS